MTATTLVEAIYNLRAALTAPDIVEPREDIVVELPQEAGERLYLFLSHNPPEELIYRGLIDWCRTIDVDGDKPQREVQFHRVKIRWPVKRVMTADGPVPEPLSDDMRMRRVPRFEQPTGEA